MEQDGQRCEDENQQPDVGQGDDERCVHLLEEHPQYDEQKTALEVLEQEPAHRGRRSWSVQPHGRRPR